MFFLSSSDVTRKGCFMVLMSRPVPGTQDNKPRRCHRCRVAASLSLICLITHFLIARRPPGEADIGVVLVATIGGYPGHRVRSGACSRGKATIIGGRPPALHSSRGPHGNEGLHFRPSSRAPSTG